MDYTPWSNREVEPITISAVLAGEFKGKPKEKKEV